MVNDAGRRGFDRATLEERQRKGGRLSKSGPSYLDVGRPHTKEMLWVRGRRGVVEPGGFGGLRVMPERWLRFVNDCGRFLDRGWSNSAQELGWARELRRL